MEHLGDITKINGCNVPPANVVIGGSPCQDLSVAGTQKGLKGERSSLFMDQIRVIREMRKAYGEPRFMVWENVPGAFSSNKGEDFRSVLEETVRLADEAAAVPRPENGKWASSGCIVGDGWSAAWRVFDAQFWGVPQRRRRIALIADLGGLAAPEILFERESLSGNTPQSTAAWKAFAAAFKNGVGTASGSGGRPRDDKTVGTGIGEAINNRGQYYGDKTETLRAESHGAVPMAYCIQGNCIDRADTAGCNGKGWTEDVSYTLNTIDRPAVFALENHPQDSRVKISENNVVQTLSGKMGTGGGNTPMVLVSGAVCIGNGQADQLKISEVCGALDCMHDQKAVITYPAGVVRRLTPLECERLQGFPDNWTNIGDWTDSKGKIHKTTDSARYKALGNSIALPNWLYVLQKLSLACGADVTMASLFDGIGGFPLIWEWLNGKGSCLWASEIEEFPIAVTKLRFGER